MHDTKRFWSKVDIRGPDDCWLWQASRLHSRGTITYGRFRFQGKMIPAHRHAYALVSGPIPPGLFVCHTCDVHACVNPAHLWTGTNADNMADMVAKGRSNSPHAKVNAAKTHCKRGHPFSGRNLITLRSGKRACRECKRLLKLKYYRRTHPQKRKYTASPLA